MCLQEKGFSSHNSYSLSKLAMQLYTFRLAELLKASGSKVTVNTCDPGTVNTKMLYAGWGACGIDLKVCTWLARVHPCRLMATSAGLQLMQCCMRNLQPACSQSSAGSVQDANNEFQLATEPNLGTGKYFVGGRQSSSSSTANNKATQQKLWDILHEQTGANYNFL